MPDSGGRLSVEVGRGQSVTIRNASMIGLSLRGVRLLRHYAESHFVFRNGAKKMSTLLARKCQQQRGFL